MEKTRRPEISLKSVSHFGWKLHNSDIFLDYAEFSLVLQQTSRSLLDLHHWRSSAGRDLGLLTYRWRSPPYPLDAILLVDTSNHTDGILQAKTNKNIVLGGNLNCEEQMWQEDFSFLEPESR